MSRGKRLSNLLRAIDLMARKQGASLDDLQQELDLSRSSVYRQIEIIQELGFPIYDEQPMGARKKRWRFDEGYLKKLPHMALPDMELKHSEVLALFMVIGESRLTRGTEIEKSLQRLMTKLENSFPAGLLGKLKKIQTLFVPSDKFSKDYSDKETVIEALTDAMLQQRVCEVRYHAYTHDEENRFTIEPLHFFEHNGGLYAYARVPKHDWVITLAVERIIELSPTSKTFAYPADFDPEDKLASAFGVTDNDPCEVKVWFSAREARYIKERKWARDQKITDNVDGSIILEMRTSGMWEVMRWVLSWGKEAEVLEPEELRQGVQQEIEQMHEMYQ